MVVNLGVFVAETLIFATTMLEAQVVTTTVGLTVKGMKALVPKPLEAGTITTMATLKLPEAVAVAVAVAVSVILAMATGILDVEVSVLV